MISQVGSSLGAADGLSRRPNSRTWMGCLKPRQTIEGLRPIGLYTDGFLIMMIGIVELTAVRQNDR